MKREWAPLPAFRQRLNEPVTPGRLPGVVRNLRAAPLQGALRVTWSPPSSSGGSQPLTYQYKAGKGRWTSLLVTRVDIKGRAGAEISVLVRAVNEVGPGPVSRIIVAWVTLVGLSVAEVAREEQNHTWHSSPTEHPSACTGKTAGTPRLKPRSKLLQDCASSTSFQSKPATCLPVS
jgi:hypothetical protein